MERVLRGWPHSLVRQRSFSRAATSPEIVAREIDEEDTTPVSLSYPSYIVWGANTGLGKTLVSTGLCNAALNSGRNFNGQQKNRNVLYVKPVQTGFPDDSDARFVCQKVDAMLGDKHAISITNHTMSVSESARQKALGHKNSFRSSEALSNSSKLACKTLWSWAAPVSPHLAVEDEGGAVSDVTLLETLKKSLNPADEVGRSSKRWGFIETAGGVASPGPSGTLQCDLYRPLRLPGILVGDGRLGGISNTVSAYESLLLRGYETKCILLQNLGLSNEQQLSKHLNYKVPVFVLPPVPQDPKDDLREWFESSAKTFDELLLVLEDAYLKRMERLSEMPKKACDLFWWPFTQHDMISQENVTVIDSRCGEKFSVYKASEKHIVESFDACASWWTQGPDAALQSELSMQVACAAGRYGHVIFPENVHEPALRCAELLLDGVGKGWADRVFFSDNGSTSIEIAMKMAFRKYAMDHGLLDLSTNDKYKLQFKVLALRGSYHGDTLGAMEAQAATPYTGFLQQPWYTGRGLFLDPPTVIFRHSKWHLQLPNDYDSNINASASSSSTWNTREEVFASVRNDSELAKSYSRLIGNKILQLEALESTTKVAAMIIEPIMHGAGGMEVIDPLFQRMLVRECKARHIPVIFDEVFTGFWRLGEESAANILGCNPDIACYAKLLTGGVVPLSATLSSKEIFQAFKGPSKIDALLHGHSYTAHPIGCTAAVSAMQWFKDPSKNLNLLQHTARLQELWDPNVVAEMSSYEDVRRIVSLGTVFALELNCDDKGYNSMSSKSLINKLRGNGVYVRSLGNVVYLMCTPLTHSSSCSKILHKLASELRK